MVSCISKGNTSNDLISRASDDQRDTSLLYLISCGSHSHTNYMYFVIYSYILSPLLITIQTQNILFLFCLYGKQNESIEYEKRKRMENIILKRSRGLETTALLFLQFLVALHLFWQLVSFITSTVWFCNLQNTVLSLRRELVFQLWCSNALWTAIQTLSSGSKRAADVGIYLQHNSILTNAKRQWRLDCYTNISSQKCLIFF